MLTTFLHLEVTWNTSHKFTGTKTDLMTPFFSIRYLEWLKLYQNVEVTLYQI